MRENGNRIEDTLYGHMLILSGGAPFGGSFAFRSTARAAGGEFESKAEKLKVNGEDLGGMSVGKFVMRSHVEKSGDYRWFTPSIELIGKLREASGPTLSEVRIAAKLRQEFRAGLALEPTPTPAAIAAPARTPRLVITSGRPLQADAIDPALNEEIPF